MDYPSEHKISDPAARLHRDAVVWDAHAGPAPFADLDLSFLDRWRTSGVSYLGINIGYDLMPWQDTVRCAAHFRRWIEMHPDQFVMAGTVKDVLHAKATGKLAVAFDMEGAVALDNNIELISMYYRLGVRHMNFAYNINNAFGGGCHDTNDIPLTHLGREAVIEMNRVGMLVDCSHSGYRTSMDMFELSTKPVIFSHSNPRALYDHGRNIRDDQMKACAATGGVIGINGISTFLNGKDATLETVFRHIDYTVNLVGIHHVGVGADIVISQQEGPDFFEKFPEFWPGYTATDWASLHSYQPEQLPGLTETLLRHGYSDAHVKLIMGENFMRVASVVWR
ncbi:dipeptidase [Mesorhizobium opportunistum]|uniref:dipeptidase n=1 Tax=Mesorhizobium opportunistum TaxID=593909 RepID=UPI00333A47C4